MNTALISSLIILFSLSIPVAVSIGLASIFGIVSFSNLPLLVVPQKMFNSLDSFPLLAIPLFILAGNIMTYGGVSRRLVEFAKSIVGGIQGGLACSCVLTCMIFATISGSAVATTFAVGAILIPAMQRQGYPLPMAASIQATSAELGAIIPPSIPMILFAVATETSVRDIFIAGIGPGALIGCALLVMILIWCRVKGYDKHSGERTESVMVAARKAFWALLLPIIVLGGIYGAVFTPTEAAAVSVVYSLAIGMFVYKEIKVSDMANIFRLSVISIGAIMLIIAAAGLFSFLISLSGLPALIGEWAEGTFESHLSFLLFVNVLLLVVGMFLETSAAILVLAPILTPLAVAFGVDPIHFGIIMIVNLALGMVTPPLGVNLFAAASVARLPVESLFKWLIWPVLTVICSLIVITYVPEVSLWLRDLAYS